MHYLFCFLRLHSEGFKQTRIASPLSLQFKGEVEKSKLSLCASENSMNKRSPSNMNPVPQATGLKKRKRGAGSSVRRRRGGVEKQERRAGLSTKHNHRLEKHVVLQGEFFHSLQFSIERDGLRTATGWHGQAPPLKTQLELAALYKSGQILDLLGSFFPVYYWLPLE